MSELGKNRDKLDACAERKPIKSIILDGGTVGMRVRIMGIVAAHMKPAVPVDAARRLGPCTHRETQW